MPLEADIAVKNMMKDRQASNPERWQMLIKLLDINPEWRMNQVSDGQRRRVQLLLSLSTPYDVLLLDEVTVDLDVVTRQDFLQFLADECEERGASIVYATHIFGAGALRPSAPTLPSNPVAPVCRPSVPDGLDDWATHIAYLSNGHMSVMEPLAKLEEYQALRSGGTASPLFRLVSGWIRKSRMERDHRADLTDAKESSEQHRFDQDLHRAAGGFAPGRMAAYA